MKHNVKYVGICILVLLIIIKLFFTKGESFQQSNRLNSNYSVLSFPYISQQCDNYSDAQHATNYCNLIVSRYSKLCSKYPSVLNQLCKETL